MPPKKKVTKTAEEGGQPEPQPKPAQKPVQPKKQEQKIVAPAQTNPVPTPAARLDVLASQPPQQSQQEPEQKVQQKPQKIVIDAAQNLTQEERIKLRKLRFGGLGTDNTLQEAERIKQQRLKKFGGAGQVEDKDTLQKRKQKFAIAGSAEDDEALKKRKDKFGLVGPPQEDNSIIEERKKKFGNPEATVSLDDEIKKNKPIKKFHHKFNNNKKWQKGFKN